jgi:hypothetical protein
VSVRFGRKADAPFAVTPGLTGVRLFFRSGATPNSSAWSRHLTPVEKVPCDERTSRYTPGCFIGRGKVKADPGSGPG